jgi:hypothetical protein
MISWLAKLFALTTASLVCAGFAVVPDATIQQGGDTPRSTVLNASRPVSDDELSQMRGGFFTAAGAQFDFGASVQTLVNGELALQTNLQWTPAGAVIQQLQGLGAPISAQAANAVASNLANAGIATPGVDMQTGTPMVVSGVQIPGAGGLTQVFANIGDGRIQNVILNSASGQDITQNTNITMTIYNFAAWQQQVAQHMLSGQLASDMLAASGVSAGH